MTSKSRNKSGRYIFKKNTTAPKIITTSIKSRFLNKLNNIYFKSLMGLFVIFIPPLIVNFITSEYERYSSSQKVAEASLTLKDYRYEIERETDKYAVFSVNYTIQNSGNQNFTLVQAIPYDAKDESSTVNYLENSRCKSYKNTIIESNNFTDFTLDVFIPKNIIEYSKIQEINSLKKLTLIDESTGVLIKPSNISSQFEIVAKVLIFGADKKYRGAVSLPYEIVYSGGKIFMDPLKRSDKTLPKSVNFEERNEYFYKCPV